MLKDSRGRLWVGSFGGGLGVSDSNLNFKVFNIENLFPSNTINAIYEDSRQNVWVGTGRPRLFLLVIRLDYRSTARKKG